MDWYGGVLLVNEMSNNPRDSESGQGGSVLNRKKMKPFENLIVIFSQGQRSAGKHLVT